jgi:hypothetical protein
MKNGLLMKSCGMGSTTPQCSEAERGVVQTARADVEQSYFAHSQKNKKPPKSPEGGLLNPVKKCTYLYFILLQTHYCF